MRCAASGLSPGPRATRAFSPVRITTFPSTARGMSIDPALKAVSVTRMVGLETTARAIVSAHPAIPDTMAKTHPNGASARATIGKLSESAAKTPKPGASRSSKAVALTWIDYAVGVNVEILLVAEPGFEPVYAQPGDAGADLKSTEDVLIPAGSWKLVATGVKIAMPNGYVGLVHPRSGLAAKQGITVLNTPGTIDAGYRGEIKVNLYNASSSDFQVTRGDRIAQLVFQKVEQARFVPVTTLPETARGEAGFGSTGTR